MADIHKVKTLIPPPARHKSDALKALREACARRTAAFEQSEGDDLLARTQKWAEMIMCGVLLRSVEVKA
jgi:hypothetical protein